MKCSKQIGIAVGIGLIAIMVHADAKADLQSAKDAYALIKADSAKAVQVQAMFEALPESSMSDAHAGYCLRIQGKYAEAIAKYDKAIKLTTNINEIINLHTEIAREYYALGQRDEGIRILKEALVAEKGAYITCRLYALETLASGLERANRHAEATPVIVERIILGVSASTNKVIDAKTASMFNLLHPEAISDELYQSALKDIGKAVQAKEGKNVEFLGPVTSELKKMTNLK